MTMFTCILYVIQNTKMQIMVVRSIYIYIYTHINVYIYIYKHICIYSCIYIYIYFFTLVRKLTDSNKTLCAMSRKNNT